MNVDCSVRIVKVKYGTKIRKCFIQEDGIRFSEFKSKVLSLFMNEIGDEKDVILEYLDEDRDWIMLENSDDLSLATQENMLYIRVYDNGSNSSNIDDVLFNKEIDSSIQKMELVGNNFKSIQLSTSQLQNSTPQNIIAGATMREFDQGIANHIVDNAMQPKLQQATQGNVNKGPIYTPRRAPSSHDSRGQLAEDDLLNFTGNHQQYPDNASFHSDQKDDAMLNHYNSMRGENIKPIPSDIQSTSTQYNQKQSTNEPPHQNQQQNSMPQANPQGFHQSNMPNVDNTQCRPPMPSSNARPIYYSTGQSPQLMGPSSQPMMPGQLQHGMATPFPGARQPPPSQQNMHMGSQQNDSREPSRNMRPNYPNFGPPQQGYNQPPPQMNQPSHIPTRPPIPSGNQPRPQGMGIPPQSFGAPPPNFHPSQAPMQPQSNRFPPPGHFPQ